MANGYRAVFTAPRQVALEPQEWADPGPGQVLLRTERTLIRTGTELTGLTGDFPPNSRWADYMRYPVGVGYSNVATVAALGDGIERIRVGERVASTAAHATHALFPAQHLRPVPEEIDAEAATFATLVEIVM